MGISSMKTVLFSAKFTPINSVQMMAYSAEPGKTVAYSDDLRWRVVWQRLGKEKPFRDIAESLNIGLGTVHNIWRLFEHSGQVTAKKSQPMERVLDEHSEFLILGIDFKVYSILTVTTSPITEDAEHCQHCGDAYYDDDESRQQEWVGCDFCWRWFHYGCIGLEEIPEQDEQWKCPECV